MTILNDTRLDDLKKAIAADGKADGEGQNAKPSYAKRLVGGAHDGVIKAADAPAMWDIYEKGAAKVKGDERERICSDDTRKVRTSETKALIGFGTLDKMQAEPGKPDKITPPDQFARFVAVINGDKCKDIEGSTYQHLIKLARAQTGRPLLAFNEEEMVNTLKGEAKAAKDELARLSAIYKAMKRCHDGSKEDPTDSFPSEELAGAMTMIEGRLAVLESLAADAKADAAKVKVAKLGKALAPAPGVPAVAA